MSLFKGSYLRVFTPLTTDGRTPRIDEEGKIMYREDPLPLSAKKDLEKLNKDLPEILRKKIEVVTSKEDAKDNKNTAKTK